jgi:pimeloyl-ACP methyl ester carboxylesterase
MHEIATRHFLGTGGIDLTADVAGSPSSPTVILLHGGGQTRHSWGGAMRVLVDAGYYVINLDARGHGDSAWCPDGRYSVETRSLDVHAVLAHVETPCALVGASMGGFTALYTAGAAVNVRIAALILVDIVPRPSAAGVKRIQSFMRRHIEGFASLDEAIDAVASYNPHRPRPSDPTGIRKNLRETSDGRFKWHWDPKILTLDAKTESDAVLESLRIPSSFGLIPTLLIRGALSDVVSDEGVADLRDRIPRLDVLDLATAGHMIAGDRNDAFNAGVIDYLRQHLPAVPGA